MLAQILAVTWMNLRSLPARLGSSSVIVVGIAGVVAVLVTLLAMAGGFSAALERGGSPERALVQRAGASSEMSSTLNPEEVRILSTMPEVAAYSPELYVVADVPKRSNNQPANLVIRGVRQDAFRVRPEIEIVAGRALAPGKRELIAGRGAAAEFLGIDLGAKVDLRNNDWTVVGLFTAEGSAYESELWADLPVAQSAFRRGPTLQSVRVRLTSPDALAALAARVEDDRRLELEVLGEEAFYAGQSESLDALIRGFGYTVAVIMAFGAFFAALNTMFTAVSARTVETATLRALGFGGGAVIASVMAEATGLALLGGALGGVVAYFGFNGFTVSTLNSASFSQVAFDFAVTPELLVLGLLWALGLGLVGGLFPAARAARLPITTALRGE